MNITFADKVIKCRTVKTCPSKFKLRDLLIGPGGTLLQVVTVQKDCPIWEDSRKTKTAVVFETEDHTIVPVSEMHGYYEVLRPCA